MSYSIGEFSKMIDLPVSTLRYYENEGLLKPDRDENNLRVYTDQDLKWVTFLLHLKGTGMSMAELKQYTIWRAEGDATMLERMELLEKRRRLLEKDIQALMHNLEVIENKIDFYEERLASAINDSTDQLPAVEAEKEKSTK
jgi:DNA-binding transcriptional MerR regulator